MMAVKKIIFVHAGFQEILNSDGVHNLIASHTEATCAAANASLSEKSEGYKFVVKKGVSGTVRWIGLVHSTDHASLVAEAEDKALSRAVR